MKGWETAMIKRVRRKLFLGGLAFLLVLSLSGCSLGTDVWTLLRAPHLTGEQEEVQTALDSYIKGLPKDDTAGGGAYVLKYPKSGDYRSAFIIQDLDGDGQKEAIAFYSRSQEGSNVHMNLLRQVDNKWKSVSDIEGVSADIERVRLGDLDGDGIQEVMTGWNINNVRDKQFVLYSITDGTFSVWDKTLYSSAVVGDLTSCGHDNLLLIYSDATKNQTTAELWMLQNDPTTGKTVLSKRSSIPIDGYIQQFVNPEIGSLSSTQKGAYVDGIQSSGGMVTELIYWDGKQLVAPFYDEQKNTNSTTYREALIPSADINDDGVIEWPSVKKLDGYSPSSDADMLWLTEWNSLDYNAQNSNQTKSKKLTCIMNMTDGYFLKFDNWNGQYTATFDSQTHLFKLYGKDNATEGNELMVLRTTLKSEANRVTSSEASDSSQIDQDTRLYRILKDNIDSLPNIRYDVWFSKDVFNMTKIEDMFYIFNKPINE